MPIYLVIAYVVFFVTPLLYGLSIVLRRRQVRRMMALLEAQESDA